MLLILSDAIQQCRRSALLLAVTAHTWLQSSVADDTGYCQVYSYNIHERHAHAQETHFFACCNNMDEGKCKGHTYQKPARTESFCTGQVIQREGTHWTQMETQAFPDRGRFYCGDCCGQRLAEDACNSEYHSKWEGCTNWVQCYMEQCKIIVAAVLANKPLGCALPPAPHPKHYWPGPRTLPANFSIEPTPASVVPSSTAMDAKNATCSDTWCKSVTNDMRCRMECCRAFCCLPDGPPQFSASPLFWGLSTLQVAGVVIGAIALLSALAAILMLLVRRALPGCRNLKVRSHDTQVLVIEGPEDVDSDPESG